MHAQLQAVKYSADAESIVNIISVYDEIKTFQLAFYFSVSLNFKLLLTKNICFYLTRFFFKV